METRRQPKPFTKWCSGGVITPFLSRYCTPRDRAQSARRLAGGQLKSCDPSGLLGRTRTKLRLPAMLAVALMAIGIVCSGCGGPNGLDMELSPGRVVITYSTQIQLAVGLEAPDEDQASPDGPE